MSGEPDTTEQTVGSPDRVVTDEQRAYWAQVEAPMASCTALITDADGRILVVDPTYKDGFDMPGGRATLSEARDFLRECPHPRGGIAGHDAGDEESAAAGS